MKRNPLRARVVRRAEAWSWSSLRLHQGNAEAPLLARGPVALPSNWTQLVHEPQTEAEVEAIRTSIARGAPYGGERWRKRAATELGLESALRSRGRPRTTPKK